MCTLPNPLDVSAHLLLKALTRWRLCDEHTWLLGRVLEALVLLKLLSRSPYCSVSLMVTDCESRPLRLRIISKTSPDHSPPVRFTHIRHLTQQHLTHDSTSMLRKWNTSSIRDLRSSLHFGW